MEEWVLLRSQTTIKSILPEEVVDENSSRTLCTLIMFPVLKSELEVRIGDIRNT